MTTTALRKYLLWFAQEHVNFRAAVSKIHDFLLFISNSFQARIIIYCQPEGKLLIFSRTWNQYHQSLEYT